jgi:hypothetical protein
VWSPNDLLSLFVTTEHLTKLVRLDLRGNYPTDAIVPALLAGTGLPALRLLRLDRTKFLPECREQLQRFRAGVQVCV